jgi:general nucleoside transport system permease protein
MTLRTIRLALTVAVAGTLLALAVVAAMQGPDAAGPAARAFVDSVAGSDLAIGATIAQATPILLIGLGATLAFRAGQFDIGQPAQFVVGGLAAGVAAPAVPGPGWLSVAAALTAAMLASALWANAVARFVAGTGVALVIASLVANYLADGVARLLVSTAFRDEQAYGFIATRELAPGERLPELLTGTGLHLGAVLVLAVFAAAAWVFTRTAAGHRLRLFGKRPAFAALSGTRPDRYRRRVLTLSGALCGLAGGIEVLGVLGRYLDGSLGGPSSVAWTGLTLAILVPTGILALLPGALLLASLDTGIAGVQREIGVGAGLGMVIQATILLAVAFSGRPVVRDGRRRRRGAARRRGDGVGAPADEPAAPPSADAGVLPASTAQGAR